MRTANEIKDTVSEAGVVASLVHQPNFWFFSENLLPSHFCDRQNAVLYLAISMLAQQDIRTVDAYNIINVLSSSDSTRRYADELAVHDVQQFIDVSDSIARSTVEEYRLLVGNVLNAALRRDVFKRLRECEELCRSDRADNIEQLIYQKLDDVMLEFSSANEIPPFSEVVDDCWEEIKARRGSGYAGLPFKFEALNQYATIERGELFIFAAEMKQGKSMMLLNCAVDLMRQGCAVLYLDSELNTRLFTARILSHLTAIPFNRLTSGAYSEDDERRIDEARQWLKKQRF